MSRFYFQARLDLFGQKKLKRKSKKSQVIPVLAEFQVQNEK